MGIINKLFTFVGGTTKTGEAAQVNADFDALYTLVNGNIDDANIRAAANIQESKIFNLTTDLAARVLKTGDTMTGILGIQTASRCGIRLTGLEPGGRDWIIQEYQGDILFFRNNVNPPPENFEVIYRLPILATPSSSIDLTPKSYVDNAYQAADTAVIAALTVGTASNTPAAIIPLRTALGAISVGALNDLDVIMNDFSFYPSCATAPNSGGGTISHTFGPTTGIVDDGSVNGKFRLINNGVSGDSTVVRWRYVTASDDPTIWVVHDGAGMIVGVWTSDDPVQGPAISIAGCTPAMFKSADLTHLTISEESLTQADQKITQEKWKPANRLYRGLQLEANDLAPAAWIAANCKIDNGQLVMK